MPSAAAHASLVSTNPTAGAVLERTPSRVVLRFDEGVSAVAGSLRVYDGDARRVDDGRVLRPDEREIAIDLPASLPQDTYTVAWRAISADSHPIRGAFTFSVGAPRGDGSGVVRQVLDDEGSPLVEPVLVVVRGLGLWALLLAAGGTALLATTRPKASGTWEGAVWGWRLVTVTSALVVLASLAQTGLTGAQAAALGAADALRPAVWGEVASSTFGVVWLVRAGLAAALAGVGAVAWRRAGSDGPPLGRPLLATACVAAVGLVVTPGLSGHARVEGPLAVAADTVHVAAAAAWVGGLSMLVLLLVVAGGDRRSLAVKVVPRFSTVALVSVIALVATGVAGGLVHVHAVSSLWESTYGQLLLAKVALLVVLVAAGAVHRRSVVPRLGGDGAAVGRLLRLAAVEVAVMAAVVGVTAVLTGEPPPRAAAASAPVSRDGTVGPYDFTVTLDPATAGPNQLHLYLLDSTGALADVDEIDVSASLPAMDIGPIGLDAVRAGPGHVVVPRAQLPLGGAWQILVSVRKGEFQKWSASVDITIRKDTSR